MSDTYEVVNQIRTEALVMANQQARSTANRVATWIVHPSYDTKGDLIEAIKHTVVSAQMISRIFDDGSHKLPEDAGVDWSLFFGIRYALEGQRGSDRDDVRTALRHYENSDKTILSTAVRANCAI
jgi:hypothetical protein